MSGAAFCWLTKLSWTLDLQRRAWADEIDRGNIVLLRSFGKVFRTGRTEARLRAHRAGPCKKLNASWARGRRRAALRSPSRHSRRLCGSTPRASDWQALRRSSISSWQVPMSRSSAARPCSAWFWSPQAKAIFQHLGAGGILVRHFREHPTWLRFGIRVNRTGTASAWR